MTVVNDVVRRRDHVIAGSATLVYDFPILDVGDIKVIQEGLTLTFGTHYTVTGVGADNGGTVVLNTLPADGVKIVLLGKQPAKQVSTYTLEAFPTTRIQNDYNKRAIGEQQLIEVVRRAVRAPETDNLDMTLPGVASRKLRALGFDVDGLPTAIDLPTSVGGDVSLATVLPTGGSTPVALATLLATAKRASVYGVKFDDSTDNQAALLTWIASLPAGGGVLFLDGVGAARHSGTLTWPSDRHFTVVGLGDEVTALKYTGTGTGHTRTSDGSTFTNVYRDMSFYSTATTGVLFESIKPGRLTMKNVTGRALSGGASAIFKVVGDATAAQFTHFENVFARGETNAVLGFYFYGTTFPGPDATVLMHCRSFQCGIGLKIEGSERIRSIGGGHEACSSAGVELEGAKDCTLDDQWFESNPVDVRMKATALSCTGNKVLYGRWASSGGGLTINVDIQTPGGGLQNNRHLLLGIPFRGIASVANWRIQAGCANNIVAFCTHSNAPERIDLGTNTKRVQNINADDSIDDNTNATLPLTTEFVSGDQTVTFGNTLSVSHGLGGLPKLVQVTLKCSTAEHGYVSGDEIPILGGLLVDSGSSAQGPQVLFDTTTVSVVQGTQYAIRNKTTQATANITATNWRYVMRAWR